MISYLAWKILDLNPNNIVLLTSSWIWYDVFINELIYDRLSKQEEVNFFIYHHITEGSQMLFGFLDKSQKELFKELIKISWIGWKVAMQILTLWTGGLIEAINLWDSKKIESIKWVWKKMAEKIILEMKDKDFWVNIIGSKINISWKKSNILDDDLYHSIRTTLSNMWYNNKHVEKVLLDLPEKFNSAEEIITYVIKNL